jgi:hypothetical protein
MPNHQRSTDGCTLVDSLRLPPVPERRFNAKKHEACGPEARSYIVVVPSAKALTNDAGSGVDA